MADHRGPIPKIIYEVLPYFYGAFALATVYVTDNLLIQLVAWVIYAAGAIIFALRSDYRRANRKVWDSNRRLVNWPEDIYELQPFVILGVAVYLLKDPQAQTTLAVGLFLLFYGGAVLAVRIVKREISWVHEWRRHSDQSRDSEVQLSNRLGPGRIMYCDRCISKSECRGTELTDKSNVAIMQWLRGRGSDESRQELLTALTRIENRTISDEELRKAVIKLRAYEEDCLAWGVRGVERRKTSPTSLER